SSSTEAGASGRRRCTHRTTQPGTAWATASARSSLVDGIGGRLEEDRGDLVDVARRPQLVGLHDHPVDRTGEQLRLGNGDVDAGEVGRAQAHRALDAGRRGETEL